MMRRPAFQFYPGDWQKDPALRRSKHLAKGVWMDMLCLMFASEVLGVLAGPNDKPWTREEIAYAVGGPTEETLKAIDELIDNGVAKVRDDGAIYCKRMVCDEEQRQKKINAGRQGGKQKASNMASNMASKPPSTASSKRLANGLAKSGSSSSSSTSVHNTPLPPKGGGSRKATPSEVFASLEFPKTLTAERFKEAFRKWVTHRMRKSKPGVSWKEFFEEQLTDLELEGEASAFAKVEFSRKQGYQGLYPPKSLPNGLQAKEAPEMTGTVEDVL